VHTEIADGKEALEGFREMHGSGSVLNIGGGVGSGIKGGSPWMRSSKFGGWRFII